MTRKTFGLFAAAVAVALLAGCSMLFPSVVGSGMPTTSMYGFSGFDRVSASQTFRVHVVPDSTYSVQVTSDTNIVPYLVARQGGSTVELGLQQGFNYIGVTVTAVVHMPALSGLDLSGASQALVDPGFSSVNPLSVGISGASNASLGGISCGHLAADISGASTLLAAGTATAESLQVSGASKADLRNCVGTAANVSVSGASQAYVNVGSGVVGYSVSGASTLYYAGSPVLQRYDLSGASQVVKLF